MEKNHNRERLLDAALSLMSDKGYLGATTREIAREAGVTELTLFRHFRSKENLLAEVLNRYSFLPELEDMLPELEVLPYPDAMREIGRRFLRTLQRRKSLVRIMNMEVNRYPQKIRKLHGEFIDRLIALLADYLTVLQERGVLRPFPADVGARAFLGMLFAYFREEEIIRGKPLRKGRLDETVDAFTDLFVHGTLCDGKRAGMRPRGRRRR